MEKLFILTESQLKEFARNVIKATNDNANIPFPDLPEALSIPSDEEIKNIIYEKFNVQGTLSRTEDVHYYLGAKWMKDKILNQIK